MNRIRYRLGAINEAKRAIYLVEAIKYLIKDIMSKPNSTRHDTAIIKAEEAIKDYEQNRYIPPT